MYRAERKGAGLPILCVHGFCQSSAYWEPMLDRLAALGRTAIAPDLPGFGRSAGLGGPYTMEAHADALAGQIASLGVPRVILVGGSMGGVVAQHFALRHPRLLERLLLVATGAYTADPAGALLKAEALANAPWDAATAEGVVGGFFHGPQPPARMEWARDIALCASQAAAAESARSNALSRTFERLAEIDVPVMIIQGQHDRARTPEHGAMMRERLANCTLAVLSKSGHTPQLEEPDTFCELALPFMCADASAAVDVSAAAS